MINNDTNGPEDELAVELGAAASAAEGLCNEYVISVIGQDAFNAYAARRILENDTDSAVSALSAEEQRRQRRDMLESAAALYGMDHLDEGVPVEEAIARGREDVIEEYILQGAHEDEDEPYLAARADFMVNYRAIFGLQASTDVPIELEEVASDLITVRIGPKSQQQNVEVTYRMSGAACICDIRQVSFIRDQESLTGERVVVELMGEESIALITGMTQSQLRKRVLGALQDTNAAFASAGN